MKKNCRTIIAVFVAIMMTVNVFPGKQSPAVPEQSSMFTNYTWYRDEDMTDPTGTNCDINVEIYRLLILYPGYTFSSSFSMGLYPFEYGYHYFYPMTIIYSDR